jgi:hypothetical protein
MGHYGTPHRLESWIEALQDIAVTSKHVQAMYMVLDANPTSATDGTDTTTTVCGTCPSTLASTETPKEEEEVEIVDASLLHEKLHIVQLPQGVSADDYIVHSLQQQPRAVTLSLLPMYVVTADRALRRRVTSHKKGVTIVNPRTFWRIYVPRLAGKKQGLATT